MELVFRVLGNPSTDKCIVLSHAEVVQSEDRSPDWSILQLFSAEQVFFLTVYRYKKATSKQNKSKIQ